MTTSPSPGASLTQVFRQAMNRQHCDFQHHVSLGHVVSAVDAAAGRLIFGFARSSAGLLENRTVVTRKLLVHFRNPVLAGDWLTVHGGINRIGTSSIDFYLRVTSARHGVVVPIGEAIATMVVVDLNTRKSTPHGLTPTDTETITIPGITCEMTAQKFDWEKHGRSIAQQLTTPGDGNLNDDMFGGVTASISQQTGVGLAQALEQELPNFSGVTGLWTVRVAEISFEGRGKAGWFVDGSAGVFSKERERALVIGTRLQQMAIGDPFTIATSRLVICRVREVSDADVGWKWELLPHGL